MLDWSLPAGAVDRVTPPGGPRPKRVEVLANFLVEKLARHTERRTSVSRSRQSQAAIKLRGIVNISR